MATGQAQQPLLTSERGPPDQAEAAFLAAKKLRSLSQGAG